MYVYNLSRCEGEMEAFGVVEMPQRHARKRLKVLQQICTKREMKTARLICI
jgi:hypothetical protein